MPVSVRWAARSLQCGDLVIECEHMLHGAEGNHHQRIFSIQAKASHVAFLRADSIADLLTFADEALVQDV
jgi:hypothetical protein